MSNLYKSKMYNIRWSPDAICHKGTKGMKWGYTDGEPNGKRKAGESEEYDGLFDMKIRTTKTSHINMGDGKKKEVKKEEVIVKKGKITKAVEKGKKKIKNFFKSGKKSISKTSKCAISKGKKKIASILKKLK